MDTEADIVIDTNVLVYASNPKCPQHQYCMDLLDFLDNHLEIRVALNKFILHEYLTHVCNDNFYAKHWITMVMNDSKRHKVIGRSKLLAKQRNKVINCGTHDEDIDRFFRATMVCNSKHLVTEETDYMNVDIRGCICSALDISMFTSYEYSRR